jgi:hypothetical protein
MQSKLRVSLAAIFANSHELFGRIYSNLHQFPRKIFSWGLYCWLTFHTHTIFSGSIRFITILIYYLFLIFNYVRFEIFVILTAVLARIHFFWNSMFCHCVRMFQRFKKSVTSQIRLLLTQKDSTNWILYNSTDKICT